MGEVNIDVGKSREGGFYYFGIPKQSKLPFAYNGDPLDGCSDYVGGVSFEIGDFLERLGFEVSMCDSLVFLTNSAGNGFLPLEEEVLLEIRKLFGEHNSRISCRRLNPSH